MKKHLIVIGVLLFLLSINLSGCIQKDDSPKWYSAEFGGSVFVFYNGTRFFVNDLTPIYLEENDLTFTFTMGLSFEDYKDSIIVDVSNPKYSRNIMAESVTNETGNYKVENLYLTPDGDSSKYPYDVYSCNVTFWAVNDTYGKLFLYNLKQNLSTSQWHIDVYGEKNQLFFTFSRVQEISTFQFLLSIGYWVIVINAFSVLLILAYRNEKTRFNQWLKGAGNLLFYVGNVIGIPFYFGVIFNYIMNVAPYGTTGSNVTYLSWIMIISVALGGISFAIKETKKKKLED